MAAQVDPLILEIRADLAKYRAELKSSTTLATTSLGRQEKSVQRLEAQMRKSSGAISGSLKGIAASLAGAFSVQQIGALIDNFTRLQNSLRVSGLEGEALANVQGKLLDLSTRYGVSINELADLYGKSSQAASELGASEAQLLQITEASAQALKITGTSATQAQGALLGLTQALSSGIVRAEEFNQINEGGLRPLLQAAANAEKYGGSVAKLRAAVVDGKLSSQEFYQAILQGSAELDAKASKATLTLAGAFTALASQLTVYVGEASAANGVTAGLAAGIGALADNLDTIIPLLAIIATGLGVGLVTNAIAARVSLAAVAAQAAGTTGALATMGVAARGAGAALLGAFGGPVGLAVTALALGIGYLVTQTSAAAVAAQANARAQEISAEAAQSGATAAERLASAHGKARVEALALARAERENIKQKLASARASLILAQAELARAKAFSAAQNQASIGASTPGGGLFIQGTGDVRKANARQGVADQEARIAGLEKGLGAIDAAIRGGAAPKISAVGDPDKKKKGGKGAGRDGPTAAEIEARFNNELINLTQQTLSAQQSVAKSAEEKAELELRSIELARTQAIEGIKAEKDYSAAQKARLIQQIETLAFEETESLAVRTRAQLAQDAADLAEAEARNRVAALEDEYDLATSIKERARIAQQIVETETAAALASVDRQLLDQDISEAKRQQLQAIRDGIVAEGARAQLDAKNGNLSPIAAELKRLNETNFGDKTEAFGVDALKDLNAGLADAIVNGGNLGDVLEDTGKRFLAQLIELTFQLLVIKPLLESLGGIGGISGGGGGILKLLGFANGTKYAPGGRALVGERGPEIVDLPRGSQVIPNGLINQQAIGQSQPGGVSVIRLELSGDIRAEMQEVATGISIQVTQQASKPIINAAVNETFRRGQRRSIGG